MARLDHPDDFSMSFGDHLDELRRRLIWALVVPVPVSFALFLLSDPLIEWLYRPLDRVLADQGLPRQLQSLGPAEVLGMKVKLSLIFAVIIAAPWILWQGWLFVRPGLYGHERRFARLLVRFSAVLTALGVGLMYFAMLPLILQLLVRFGSSPSIAPSLDPRVEAVLAGDPEIRIRARDPAEPRPGDAWILWPGHDVLVAVEQEDPAAGAGAVEIIRLPASRGSIIAQEFRLTTYINFVLLLMLGIVIAFQMPLVILLLGWMGVVSAPELRAKRRWALFITAIVAAVITPPDALSMIIMLVPLYGLYELSILLLVWMPASAVAEGTILQRLRRGAAPSHHGPAQSTRARDATRADPPGRKGAPASQATGRAADDGEERQ